MIRKLLAVSAGLVLAAMLPSCSDSSSPTPVSTPPPTTTPPCTQSVLFQGSGELPSLTLVPVPFTTTATARVDATIDWTFADSSIGVWLVSANTCNIDQFNARSCNFLIRSESGGKPRKVSAANVAAGAYELLIGNFGSQDESGTAQVVQSSASCPALTSVRGDGADVAFRPRLTRAARW